MEAPNDAAYESKNFDEVTAGVQRGETDSLASTALDDDRLLRDMGYVPSFRREFTNLATVCAVNFSCLATDSRKRR